MRVSDYISNKLVECGIKTVFSVVGGGAMHLNDAFGHDARLNVVYNHHEQASAMAAEAYARINNEMAAVCVTTGPGATNAITGVVGAWMDSIPLLVFSGQARYCTTVPASGLPLRTRGVQEFQIIDAVAGMTKYCALVSNPEDIRFCLEKAIKLAREGRPGPCWLDIPLDVQGADVDVESLKAFDDEVTIADYQCPSHVPREILDRINHAERPVMHIGNGVRLSGAHDRLLQLVDVLSIPVVTSTGSVDAIPSDNPYFAGRCGTTGDRAGNFAVQNSDVFISLGGRLGYFQTGFDYQSWARNAYKIINDIDAAELEKDSIAANMKICCDAGYLIDALLKEAHRMQVAPKTQWVNQCSSWRNRYPVITPHHICDPQPNIYVFFDCLTRHLGGNDTLIVSCGTSRVVGTQASVIAPEMRFITNPNTASMGFDLPAAIGAWFADPSRRTTLVTGEGSLQMNLQELQTIVHNNIPVKIFVMNNGGYHSIRMTQRAFFGESLVGVGPESGDLSFPDLSKLAFAYGIPYRRCSVATEMPTAIDWALDSDEACMCEMILSTEQVTEPKASSKMLDDGTIVSMPLESMAPFLSRDEIAQQMYIPMDPRV